MSAQHTPAPWERGDCQVPMWTGGLPAGLCGEAAHGHQLPERYLRYTRGWDRAPYCGGHACPKHGGPGESEPRIFQDGWTPAGYPMWCAVFPGFVNLQESAAGFDGDPLVAVEKLRAAVAKAAGRAA